MKRLLVVALFAVAVSASAVEQGTNNVALPLSSAAQVLIPVAGSAPGAFGTFFRSEITIINYATREQRINIRWIPQGGGAGTSFDMTLPARTGFSSTDFVGSMLTQSGLGSIVVSAMTSGGSVVDPSSAMYVTSRIWTPQPGTTGTTSQSFLTIPLSSANNARVALVGLKRDLQYRLNVGVVNLHPTEQQTFQITADGSDPNVPADNTTLTVPANGMQQINLPAPPQADIQVVIENVTPSATRSTSWAAWGSSTDNITGDSWSMIGFTPPGTTP